MPGIYAVTSPPATAALTTLANVREELQITTSAEDRYLSRLIDRASSVIAEYCGRPFGVLGATETYRFGWEPGIGPTSQQVAPYGTPLNVQYKPLVTSFVPVLPGAVVAENGTVLTADTDYEVDVGAGTFWRLRNGLRSWWGVPLVTIAYQAGYALPGDADPPEGAPTMPPALEAVCMALVAAAFTSRGRNPAVVKEQVEGVGSTGYQLTAGIGSMVIDAGLADALAPFRMQAW